MASAETVLVPPKNDPRTIFGWCMYDWANSAYTMTSIVTMPLFFAGVMVGEEGLRVGNSVYTAATLWPFTIAAAAIVSLLMAPVLGAIADYSASKKKFLLTFAYLGAVATVVIAMLPAGHPYLTMAFVLVSQVGFVSANVFYDAFLPQIATDDKMDWVSGKGYAYGYIGGALGFAIGLGVLFGHEALHLSVVNAVRIGIAICGLWWALFTLVPFARLREVAAVEQQRKSVAEFARLGFSRTLHTLGKVARFKPLLIFLLGFFLYNDGIQTVIAMASTYGKTELKLSEAFLSGTFLFIQFVAMVGALIFGKLSTPLGTKRTLMLTLACWAGVVSYAYTISTAKEFLVLAVLVGLVLGGSQALSRSFYASMVPPQASAEFFGFFTVFTKGSDILGLLVFGTLAHLTGSSRKAIISLILFFFLGLILLWFVDEEKARAARAEGAF